LRVHAPAELAARTVHPASVLLPERARGAFQLTDVDSALAVDVTLEDASDAAAEVAGGFVVYRRGIAGADVVHRPGAQGTEDYVAFERPPASPELRYGLQLNDRVAGLRLVAGTLELLDSGGVPRLRMAPPYVVGADGRRQGATVELSGCAYDADP